MNTQQPENNSSSQKALLIAVIVFIIIVFVMGGTFLLSNSSEEDSSSETVAMSDDTSIDEMLNNEDEDQFNLPEKNEIVKNDSDEDSQPGLYTAYSQALLQNASDGSVVLFFHAPWCPTCKLLNDNLEENQNSISSDLTILKTDYDSETDLKKKYGVTYQHTLVQVDASGNLIKKWLGSNTLEDVVSELEAE